MVIKK